MTAIDPPGKGKSDGHSVHPLGVRATCYANETQEAAVGDMWTNG